MNLPVIARKFAIPPLPEPHLARPALLERLSEGLGSRKRLTVVRGGPGSGKTAALAEYARQVPALEFWYGLTASDSDPAVFFWHLVRGMQLRVPELPGQAAAVLEAQGTSGAAQAIGLLCDELSAVLDAPLVAILDDSHFLPTNPEAVAGLEALLRFFPDDSQLVLAGRGDLPLKTGRELVRGELLLVGEDDLRFSPDEVARLLERCRGAVTPEAAARVAERTRGWVTGVAHAAASGAGHAGEELEHPARLFAYLSEEVFDDLDAPFREALLQSSFLPRLDRPSCQALLGPAAEEFLGRLGRLRPFVSVRGDELAFQPLFREFLQREYVGRFLPDAQRAFFRRLADAAAEPEDAVEAYLRAEEWRLAEVRLAERFGHLVAAGRTRTASLLLDSFPPAWVRDSAGAQYMLGELARREGRLAAAIRLLARAEHLARGAAGAGGEPPGAQGALRGAIWASLAAAHGARGDLDEQIAYAERALDVVPPEDWQTGAFARNVLGLARVARLDLAAAQQRFREALALYEQHGDEAGQIRVLHNQGLAHAKDGDFERAIAAYSESVRQAEASGLPPLPVTCNNLALCHLYLGRPAEAWRALERGMALAERVASRRDRLLLLRTLGQLHLQAGDGPRAREAFEASLDEAAGGGDRLGRALALLGLAEEALAAGDTLRARAQVAQAIEAAGKPEDHPDMVEAALMVADIALQAGEEGRAAALLERVRGHLAAAPNHYQAYMAERLQVRLARARGDAGAASAAEGRLAALAARFGYPAGKQAGAAAAAAGPGAATERSRQPEAAVAEVPAGLEVGAGLEVPAGAETGLIAAAPTVPSGVEVFALGPFGVRIDGRELNPRDWRSGNAKVVLAYLLLHPLGATKERFLDLLYPHGDPARSALPTVINRLRQTLEPGAAKGAPSRFIHFRDGRYLFTRGVPVSFDLARLRSLVGQAREPNRPEPERRALLEQAVGLYRGPFMEDFLELPWCQIERENARRLACEAYDELFAILAGADLWPEVERQAEACLGAEPTAQAAQRAKILALAMQERFADALRFEAVVTHALREDHGLDPEPETADLAALIREGRLTVRAARDFLPTRW